MPNIKIFSDSDSAQDIFDRLQSDGLIGISGGRLSVRTKLNEVRDLIGNHDEENSYRAHSTINHPDTELGYAYDEEVYDMDEAVEVVTRAYDVISSLNQF